MDVKLQRPFLEDLGPLAAGKGVQHLEKGEGLNCCGGGPLFGGSRPLMAGKGVQRQIRTHDPRRD